MKLVTLAAIIAVCGAAKLDRSYLPPPSAASAGGTSDSLQAPLIRSSEGLPSIDFPTGSYTNSFQGVVVDAAAPGTRASSDSNQSGLGGPRETYGSTNSKVGDAAFRGSVAGFRTPPIFGGSIDQASGVNGQNFLESKPERPQASKDRNSNIISYANDVSLDNYSYGFETDNGIAVGENGVANNGIQAQGGYSYKGDDGQVYKVTYTADESGYRPQGSHLPTPPPIPKEILVSLEQNAKEEAAGLVDDGSYDAQKYNTEGDYTHNNGGNIQYNGVQLSQSKRPESDAAASSTFINQNSLTFGRPSAGQFGNVGTQNGHASFNTQSSQYGGSQINHNHLAGSQHKESSQALSGTNSHFSSTQSTFGSFSSQVASQNNQQGLAGHSETQNSNTQTTQSQFGNQGFQFGSQAGQLGSTSQFGVQPTKPSFGQSFSNPALAGNQGTQLEIQQGSYGQSVNHAQNSQSVGKPQYNQGHFGVTQNQLSNKPSSGIFTSNKPSTNNQVSSNAIASSGSSNNNRFPNVPNQFGSAYLPPFTTNDKPALNKPQTAEVATFEPNKNAQSINTVPHAGQFQTFPQASALPSASAFVSSSQSGFVSQPGAPVNSFQISAQPNQISNNNSLTMQGVINSNLSPSSSPNKESNTAATISPFVISQSKPTAIPDTELTTPLEPGEKPAFSQQSPFNTQFSSNYGNSGSQTINTVDQTQLGSQSNVISQQSGQSGILPGGSSLISITSTPAAFPTVQQTGFSTQNPLFSHNQFSQTQQNNAYYSTQKPSFSQGPDDSYYYNQPSKPFITPAARPQGSRFPNTPSYQSNGIASSQNNQLTSQQGTFPSNTNLPSKPSYTSVAPISSQNTHTQGSFSNNFNNNGITEAAISPFPPASPTTSTQLGTTLIDQSRPSSNLLGKPTIIQQSSTFQTFTSKPNIGQKPSTFTQSQVQTGQTSSNNQPINSQTLTQQYQGTIYQYNKPAQTLPAPAQTDSSSSQSIQTDSSSKPQLGSQQTQFNQNSFGSQSQQTSFNQGSNTKPQFGIQNNKPFGSSLSNTQFAQNTQGTFSQTSFQQNSQASHNNVHPIKPNGSQFIQATQTGTSGQQSFGSQFNSQAVKPIGSSSSSTTFGQNTQQAQGGINAGHFTSSQQTHEAQNSVHGQNTQNSFGSQNSQQTGVQFGKPSNKPFGSVPRPQFGQVSQSQGSYSSGFSSSQQNVQGSQFTSQPFKPFGISGFAQSTGTKPQIGTQTSQALFTQNSQQSFGTQASSQPAQTGVFPTRPSAASSTVHGSPDSLKPHFGQNTGTQGNKPLSAFEQFFQSSQYGSSASKPQIGVQTQFGQNAPTPAQGTGISTNQYGQASVQTPVQTSQTPQSYKPFGSSSGSSVHHQASQTSQTGATASGSASFGTQTYKPFGASQGPTNKPQIGSLLTPCCKNSQGSSTKPNQAFGQAQNQVVGFQGTQSFSAQSVAGKGEEFGGPREPPRFDAQTGYHY